jgi:hypothetical protein
MEGECYAFIWGVMHFQQFLHQTFFLLKSDHKPLKWLTIVSNVNLEMDIHAPRFSFQDYSQGENPLR